MKNLKIRWIYGIVFAFILAGFTTAHAHRVSVFAWVEGDMVHTQSKFGGGKKVKQGKVIVTDLNGNQLLTGVTDENGEFSFKIPQKTALKIVMEAGMGHRGEWTLTEKQINPDADSASNLPSEPAPSPANASNTPSHATPSTGNTGSTDPEMVKAIVGEVMDEKLRPVIQLLVDSQTQGPGLTEILGGIGYILGLVGVAAYFQSRKKS